MRTIIWILMVMLCVVVAEWNTKDHIKREHSLTKPYIGSRRISYIFFQFLLSRAPPTIRYNTL